MRAGSLFSGIGGLDHGLARAGWEHAFFCESDEWRRGVLRAHWPGVPVHDDVRDLAQQDERGRRGHPEGAGLRAGAGGGAESDGERPERGVDLLCGGFPCQDLSVAGQRRGLAGSRSSLFFEFARVADAFRPQWILVENVPGLLSSNGGRDFGIVVGTLADLGYGLAWRVLDSRFFGVPQRRRRVFIVGTRANGDPRAASERAGQVLAVGSRCDRHPATRREAREEPAVASLSGLGTGGPDDNDGQVGRLVARALTSPKPGRGGSYRLDDQENIVAHTLKAQRGKGGGGIGPEETLVAAPLSHGSNPNSNAAGRRREDDYNLVTSITLASDPISAVELAQPSAKRNGDPGVISSAAQGVRRLTPRECERLQALPDDWTAYGPDSRRYAALGDAVTSSVAEWIGRRLIQAGAEAPATPRRETERSAAKT